MVQIQLELSDEQNKAIAHLNIDKGFNDKREVIRWLIDEWIRYQKREQKKQTQQKDTTQNDTSNN